MKPARDPNSAAAPARDPTQQEEAKRDPEPGRTRAARRPTAGPGRDRTPRQTKKQHNRQNPHKDKDNKDNLKKKIDNSVITD